MPLYQKQRKAHGVGSCKSIFIKYTLERETTELVDILLYNEPEMTY